MRDLVYISDQKQGVARIPLDVLRDRDLLWALVRRDFTVRYRFAAIGAAWAVLEPLALCVVLTVVFSVLFDVRVIDPAIDSRWDFAALLLAALIPWQFTADALQRSPGALLEHQDLIRKARFSREIVPLSVVGIAAGNFVLAGMVLFVLLTVFVGLPGQAMAALPAVIAIQIALLSGAALVLAPANLYFRDVAPLARVATLFGFYATPIFYTTDTVRNALASAPWALQWMKPLYFLNPMVGLTEGYRDILVYQRFPEPSVLVWPAVCGGLLLLLGIWFFRKRAATIADVL